MKTKYIRWGVNILIFPGHMIHSEVAANIDEPIDGAGFVEIREGTVRCYGESISLDIKTHPMDSQFAAMTLGLES